MITATNLFVRPAPWGIGAGPVRLDSIDAAVSAVEVWLRVTPDVSVYRQERLHMLALRDILEQAQDSPHEADLQSAKLAIKGMVRLAQSMQRRRDETASVARLRARPQ